MSYSTPPNVTDSGTITTSAAAGTNVGTILLGAPGVGFAYRIVGIACSPNRTATGLFNLLWIGSFSIFRANGYGPPPTTPVIWWAPEPGIQIPENVAFSVQHNSNLASQQFFCQTYYFTDLLV